MSSIDALISKRMGSPQGSTKVKELAKRSSEGNLTSFSGLFKVIELSIREKEALEKILSEYSTRQSDHSQDLTQLISITSEVKAINNQAALLHGERIKQAQAIFQKYKEGAFSAWLITSYGNRQTPYNFMLYYEFSTQLPHLLRQKVDTMPRQVIYTLASRDAPIEEKQNIVEAYSGQTKQEMLELIREKFPLDARDERKADKGQALLMQLTKLYYSYKQSKLLIDDEKNDEIITLVKRLLVLAQS